jgi:hypothetical protein
MKDLNKNVLAHDDLPISNNVTYHMSHAATPSSADAENDAL